MVDGERTGDGQPGQEPHPVGPRVRAHPVQCLLEKRDLRDIEELDLEPSADRPDTERRSTEEDGVSATASRGGDIEEHPASGVERTGPGTGLREPERRLRIVVAHLARQLVEGDGLVRSGAGECPVAGESGPVSRPIPLSRRSEV